MAVHRPLVIASGDVKQLPSGDTVPGDAVLYGSSAATAAEGNHTHAAAYQPLDGDLTAIAALAPSDGSLIQRVSGAWNSQTAAQVKASMALVKGDVGLGNVDNTADTAKPVSTAQQTALDAKVPTSRTLTASTGLTGGGDLSANRSFAVAYGSAAATAVQGNDARVTADQAAATASIRTLGTGATQACAGNDARLSDARTPTAHAHAQSDVTNLVTALAAKQDTATLGEVTQDTVAAMFAGGTHSNVTVTYDDADGTLDLAATGGGTNGVPAGGATNSLLAKLSATDYDDAWKTPTEVTALLNLASTTLKGLMSPAEMKRGGAIYDAQADFGFVGDCHLTLLTTSVTGTTMTDTSNPFTAADVGKRVVIPRAGAGSGVNAAMLVTTITGYNNAGSVTIGTAATNAVANVMVQFGTDNSAAEALMVNTINNQPWAGARVMFGRSETNRYGVSTNWLFTKNCQIEGIGGGHTADAGTWRTLGGTALAWWGSSSDGGTDFQAMITFRPTGDQALKRVALRHIWLDCRNCDQNQALFGLELNSCHGHMLEDFYVNDPLATAIVMDVASSPTEAKDCTRFSHRDICVRVLDHTPGANTTPTTTSNAITWSTTGQNMTLGAANSLRTSGYVWVMCATGYPVLVKYTGGGGTTVLTGCKVSADDLAHAPASFINAYVVEASPGNAMAYKMNGIVGANTCLGVIEMIQISYGTSWGPAAIETLNCDSILFLQPSLNGGNATVEPNGNRTRRPGIRFNGSNANAGLPSRNNIIYNGDPGAGGCVSVGENNAGTALSFPSGPNKWYNYQLGNGAPVPIVEGAAQFYWTANGGMTAAENGPVKSTATSVGSASTVILAQIPIPPQGLQIGTMIRCRWKMTKTAAGTAARITGVKIGNAGTPADPTVNSVSRTPTAAADHGTEEILFCVTGPLGATCTSVMSSELNKRLVTAAGFFNVAAALDVLAGTPVTFNSVGPKWLSIFMTTGLSEVVTVLAPVVVEVLKGAGP